MGYGSASRSATVTDAATSAMASWPMAGSYGAKQLPSRCRARRLHRPMGASGGGGHVAMPGPGPRNPQVPLRVGILGAGMIATVEPGYLPGLRRLRGRVAVTAIASRTRARAEQVARDWDIPVV